MNLKLKMCLTVGGTLLLSGAALQAQRPVPEGPRPGTPMELMGFEGVRGGAVVKGAPFSATATSETTQTLQDGSAIHRTSQVTMYRDSQGRSRHETTFTGFGPLQASGTPKKMISISDPVAGVHILLDNEQKVAHRMLFRMHGGAASTDREATRESRRAAREAEQEAAGLLKKESLGTQMIDGVMAEGTRTTKIIPAGQIGNEKALQIVAERWYSPDLQIVLKSTRSDPWSGTTTYTVTNIQRSEPATSLFTVPSDFTVQTGGPRRAGAPGRPPMEPPPDLE
jgi:hypothetical protein